MFLHLFFSAFFYGLTVTISKNAMLMYYLITIMMTSVSLPYYVTVLIIQTTFTIHKMSNRLNTLTKYTLLIHNLKKYDVISHIYQKNTNLQR